MFKIGLAFLTVVDFILCIKDFEESECVVSSMDSPVPIYLWSFRKADTFLPISQR